MPPSRWRADLLDLDRAPPRRAGSRRRRCRTRRARGCAAPSSSALARVTAVARRMMSARRRAAELHRGGVDHPAARHVAGRGLDRLAEPDRRLRVGLVAGRRGRRRARSRPPRRRRGAARVLAALAIASTSSAVMSVSSTSIVAIGLRYPTMRIRSARARSARTGACRASSSATRCGARPTGAAWRAGRATARDGTVEVVFEGRRRRRGDGRVRARRAGARGRVAARRGGEPRGPDGVQRRLSGRPRLGRELGSGARSTVPVPDTGRHGRPLAPHPAAVDVRSSVRCRPSLRLRHGSRRDPLRQPRVTALAGPPDRREPRRRRRRRRRARARADRRRRGSRARGRRRDRDRRPGAGPRAGRRRASRCCGRTWRTPRKEVEQRLGQTSEAVVTELRHAARGGVRARQRARHARARRATSAPSRARPCSTRCAPRSPSCSNESREKLFKQFSSADESNPLADVPEGGRGARSGSRRISSTRTCAR